MDSASLNSAFNFLCFPVGYASNSVLSKYPIEHQSKKNFVEQGTSMVSFSNNTLETSNISSSKVGIAITMTTGECFLAHFTESSTVSVSIDKSLDKILKRNPSARLEKLTICGGKNVDADPIACMSHTGKYMLMASTACVPSAVPGVISSLAIYMSCSIGGRGREVFHTVLRDTVINHATHICNTFPGSDSKNTSAPIIDIRPVDINKTFSLTIAEGGEIIITESLSDEKETYENQLNIQCLKVKESSFSPVQPITRPIILTNTESKTK
ncbi:hypothetical protein HOG98_06625 [bacterium]|jgi:hypothetical protein|nr:hypothetical protein [bacterium]